MKRHPTPVARLIVLVCIAFASLAVGFVSAQEAPTEIDFTVTSFSCDADPGEVSPIADNIPDSCTPDAGAIVNVALEDGTAVGTCTIDASGLCKLQAPNESTVVVTLDESTVTSGNVPRENPITTKVVTEFAGALFINVPATSVSPEVPTELPDTGSGLAEEAARFWVFIGSLVVIGSWSAALGLRLRYAATTDK